MRVRPMEKQDWSEIPRFRGQYGFDWKFPEFSSRIAAGCVIEDDGGPFALCAAELVPTVSMAMEQKAHPLVKLRAGVMIHEYLKEALSGYPEMVCEVAPELEGGYTRHLQRIFGWREMWKGYKL